MESLLSVDVNVALHAVYVPHSGWTWRTEHSEHDKRLIAGRGSFIFVLACACTCGFQWLHMGVNAKRETQRKTKGSMEKQARGNCPTEITKTYIQPQSHTEKKDIMKLTAWSSRQRTHSTKTAPSHLEFQHALFDLISPCSSSRAADSIGIRFKIAYRTTLRDS